MFLFSAAKKVAEVAGVIDEPEIIIIDEPMPSIAGPVEISQHIEVKQVGNVAPFVRIIDPADDLAILEELFGVYRTAEKVMVMSCPDHDCDAEYTMPYETGLDLDGECACPDCGYEDTFSDFLDQIDTKSSTSRTPSAREVLFAAQQDAYSHWDHDDIERIGSKFRDSMLKYYAVLTGNAELLCEYDIAHGRRDDGLNSRGEWKVSCSGCQGEDDGCQCNNSNMKHFGKLVSIKGMDDVEEDDE